MNPDKDWKDKYKTLIDELETREAHWANIESILRKAIGRLSIAGRGLDTRLDEHLKEIQKLSRNHQDEKLALALEKLDRIVSVIDDTTQPAQKPQKAEPVKALDTTSLLLELLQSIKFRKEQRPRLKTICSDLLQALARGKNRANIKRHIQALSTLINENFSEQNLENTADNILLELIALLDLDESAQKKIQNKFSDNQSFTQQELSALAKIINSQLSTGQQTGVDGASISDVLTTLLERLTVVQGVGDSASLLQSRVLDGIEENEWSDTLNEIVASITDTLKRLNEEKHELEGFIWNVTEQLGQITEVISADSEDHLLDQEDRQSLHDLMQESVITIKSKFDSVDNILQLKSEVTHNIDLIRSGVEEFMVSANTRQQAIEERNHDLLEKISSMEKETETLQKTLTENRKKLLFDSLTGVGSRLAYDEHFEQEMARWKRYGTTFSYAILDIDHFKNINDRHGHSAGDKALKIAAKMMLSQIRKADSIYRIGGEEFVLLLPNTKIQQAEPLVNKLRESIANSDIHFKQERVLLTLSAGLTEPRENDDINSLYERADSALYRAKNSGRNCQFVA